MTKSIWASILEMRPINKMAQKVTKKDVESFRDSKKHISTKLPISKKLDSCPYCSIEISGKLARHLTKSKKCWRANKEKIKEIK